jgi:3-oxoacyl-[acyl-carrier-protein] synthase II
VERRVVITGLGLVTPLGVGVEPTWAALLEGRSGAGPITQFDTTGFATTFACEVRGFEPTDRLDRRLAKTLDRFVQLALVAAIEARADSGLEVREEEAERVGVFVGAGLGGVQTIERTMASLREKGPRHGISPYFIPAIIINLAAGQISILFGAKGPNLGQVSACSSSAHSVGDAYHCIRRGDADAMFAGGSEAAISPLGVGGFVSMKALSTRNAEPARASRPFDADRDGFVIGEGAGMLVLEELERARRRGARIYAEIVGYGLCGDAHHITSPPADGEGAQRCMRMALRGAGLAPDAVTHINAHGTSTKTNDAVETAAIKRVFGDHARRIAIASTKSMTGHLLGAAGGVETSFTALAISRGVVPPTINYETPDPECDLDYTPNVAREMTIEVAMSNSFGFGGTNACLLLKRFSGA